MDDTKHIRPRIVIEFEGEQSTAARITTDGKVDRGQRMIARRLIADWDRDYHEAEKAAAARQQFELAQIAQQVRERNGRS